MDVKSLYFKNDKLITSRNLLFSINMSTGIYTSRQYKYTTYYTIIFYIYLNLLAVGIKCRNNSIIGIYFSRCMPLGVYY